MNAREIHFARILSLPAASLGVLYKYACSDEFNLTDDAFAVALDKLEEGEDLAAVVEYLKGCHDEYG